MKRIFGTQRVSVACKTGAPLSSSYRACSSGSSSESTFVSGLFRRQLSPKLMFPFPKTKISNAEQSSVDKVLNAINNTKDVSAVKGLCIPFKYDGLELSHTSQAAVMETIGEAKLTDEIFSTLHTYGCVHAFAKFGGEGAMSQYLPKIVSGEAVFAMAVSEPLCESDISSCKTTAKFDGHTSTYTLNGTKSLRGLNASLTDNITHFLVIAKVDLGTEERLSSMFMVERKADGVAVDGSTVTFTNARVAELVGPVSDGFSVLMVSKHSSRFCYDAAMIGTAKGLYNALMDVKASPEILNFVAALIYGMESALYAVTATMDSNHDDVLLDAAFATIAVNYSSLRIIAAVNALADVSTAGLAPEVTSFKEQLSRLVTLSEPISGIQAVVASCGVEDFGIEFQAESTLTTMGSRMLRGVGHKKKLPLKVSWPEVAQIEDKFAAFGDAVESTFVKCGPALRYRQLAMERVAKSGAFIFAACAAVSRAERQEKKATGIFERSLCKTLLPILTHEAGVLIDEINKSALAPDGGLIRVVGEMTLHYVPINPNSDELKAEDEAKKALEEARKKLKEEEEKKKASDEQGSEKKA